MPEEERFFFPVPALIATLEPIKMISCGADHTIAMGNVNDSLFFPFKKYN